MNCIQLILLVLVIIIIIYLIGAYVEHDILTKTNFVATNKFNKFNNSDFHERVIQGKHGAKNKRIVLCGLTRDSGIYIKTAINLLETIGQQFGDYRIIIFENDSKDNTRAKIQELSKINNKIILLDCCTDELCNCKYNTINMYKQLPKERIKKMALFRDKYLSYVKKHLYDYDYLLVYDFDLSALGGKINIDGLFHSLSFDKWDGIFINGRNSVPGSFGYLTTVYDPLAFISIDDHSLITYNLMVFMYVLFLMNKEIYKRKLNKQTALMPVKSAFNGIAIYKVSSIINSSYDGDSYCEHISLHKDMRNKGYSKLFLNPFFEGYFPTQGCRNTLQMLALYKDANS